MKSLKESLFDDDLATKELDVEKISKNFDSKTFQSLKSVADILDRMEAIVNAGKEYTFDQLKKKNIDLSKNIVVYYNKHDFRKVSYNFIFMHNFYDGLNDTYKDCLLIGSLFGRNSWAPRNYEWIFNIWGRDVTVESAWSEYLKSMQKYYIDNGAKDIKFYMLPKNISENIIKCMLKK